MQPDDDSLLVDMLVAAKQAVFYLEGLSLQEFHADESKQDAVIHQIQIVGEAASRVSQSLRDSTPEIPWEDIIGMRHRLVHDYRRVNRDIVWSTVHSSIPALIEELEKLAPPQ